MASLTIAKVRGIPLRLHVTFLLVLPVFAYLMARFYFTPEDGALTANAWIWGSLLAIGLFTSVLLHELGHSLMALRQGVGIRSITLLPIGGVSAFEEVPREAAAEFKITVVGPLVNFVIGLPLIALVWFTDLSAIVPGLERFVFWLAVLNLVLGAFNLFVPAFPMDGGRVLRSLLIRPLGRLKATRVASLVGRGLAFAMALWGILTFAAGGWLLLLIAFFVYSGAREEEDATALNEALLHYRVADLMTQPVDTLPPEATVEESLQRMLATKHVAMPVVEEEEVLGIVHLEELQAVPENDRWQRRLGELLPEQEIMRLHPEDEATEAARLLRQEPGQAVVMDAEGHLHGIVTRTDVVRFAQIAQSGVTLPRGRRPAQPGFGSG